MIPPVTLDVSGERFGVVYRIAGSLDEVQRRAEHICIEQTIEFPADLVADDDIRGHVFGRIESVTQLEEGVGEVSISYAYETTALTLPQTINVVFGNISLEPGVQVHRLSLPDTFTAHFKGPRFGRAGLRELCGEPDDPLYCSALKPMGLSSRQLARQAYEFAKGGIHFIKDDHGISGQVFSRFRERVPLCIEAVEKANRETGQDCRYVPTINSPAERLVDDARWAKAQGAGGLLVPPGITGWDTMRRLADDDEIGLPILSHPAFLGSYSASPRNGLSHFALYGQMVRLAGGDATIYPNFGGRFSFSIDQCRDIVAGTETEMGAIKPIFPCPGGGMNFGNIAEMVSVYGNDIIFLIGGALHAEGATVSENCRKLRRLVSRELNRPPAESGPRKPVLSNRP